MARAQTKFNIFISNKLCFFCLRLQISDLKMSRARWLENKISPNVVRRATTSHIMQKSKEGDNVPSRYTRKATFENFFPVFVSASHTYLNKCQAIYNRNSYKYIISAGISPRASFFSVFTYIFRRFHWHVEIISNKSSKRWKLPRTRLSHASDVRRTFSLQIGSRPYSGGEDDNRDRTGKSARKTAGGTMAIQC